ncbi:hypothetical protein ACOSQ4_030929 [Xanthoceras sorbifolium]
MKSTADYCSSSSLANWWTFLWKLHLLHKIKIFIWRICHDGIPSLINLVRHHVPTSSLYLFCLQKDESTLHALWLCLHLQVVRDDYGFGSLVSKVASPSMLNFFFLVKHNFRWMTFSCSVQFFVRFGCYCS